jgi:hypothetical protein
MTLQAKEDTDGKSVKEVSLFQILDKLFSALTEPEKPPEGDQPSSPDTNGKKQLMAIVRWIYFLPVTMSEMCSSETMLRGDSNSTEDNTLSHGPTTVRLHYLESYCCIHNKDMNFY